MSRTTRDEATDRDPDHDDDIDEAEVVRPHASETRGVGGGRIGDGGAGSRIDEIEARIASLEALNEVQAELSEDVKEAEVDAKLASLAGETELDDALAALKKKVGAQQSLPPGETKGEG